MPNGIDMVAIRSAIRNEMAKLGITSAKLGDETGIPKGTIDNFLDGSTASPAFDRVCAIAKALNVSLDALIGIRSHASQDPIIIPTDIAALQQAHKQTLEAKEEHLEELKRQNLQLREQNRRLTAWHRVFVTENIFLAALAIVDFFVPTFGYFRDALAKKLSSRSMWC